MGLDVRVYKNCRILDMETATEEQKENAILAFVIDPSFECNIEKLVNEAYYIGNPAKAGLSCAYGSHRVFREKLAELTGRDVNKIWGNPDQFKEAPFFRLINFADNEGCIDWATSEMLYNDFVKFQSKAEVDFPAPLFGRYKEWMEVFRVGKEENSIIEFS